MLGPLRSPNRNHIALQRREVLAGAPGSLKRPASPIRAKVRPYKSIAVYSVASAPSRG